MRIVYRLWAAGHYKRMFAGTPIPDVGDLFKNSHFCRSPGLHELNNINLQAIACGSHRQPNSPGGFTDPLPVIDMNETEAFFFNVSAAFLWVKNSAYLLNMFCDLLKYDEFCVNCFIYLFLIDASRCLYLLLPKVIGSGFKGYDYLTSLALFHTVPICIFHPLGESSLSFLLWRNLFDMSQFEPFNPER